MSVFTEFPLGELPSPANVMLIGLPGVSVVGRRVVDKILEVTKSTELLKTVPHFLPDILIADEEGRPYLPGLDFYRSNKGDPTIVSVTSNFQIDLLPSPFSYWIAEYLVRKAKEFSCNKIAVLGTVLGKKTVIFYLASGEAFSPSIESLNLTPLQHRSIEGISALVLPMSRFYKIPAIELAFQVTADGSAPPSLVNDGFSLLVRLLDLNIP